MERIDKFPQTPVQLFFACLYAQECMFEQGMQKLAEEYGALCQTSEPIPFDMTDYYEKEMGQHLTRRFFALEKLGSMMDLVDIKLFTMALERQLSNQKKRTINIDPAFLDLGKCIFASNKEAPHKLPMGHGVYFDYLYYYSHGSFHPLPWSFPDMKVGLYEKYLQDLRLHFRVQKKKFMVGNAQF